MQSNIFVYYFILGGPFMVPLALLLLFSIFIIIERILYYVLYNWSIDKPFKAIHSKFKENNDRVKISPLEKLLQNNISIFTGNTLQLENWLESDMKNLLNQLRRNLFFLQIISVLAPVIGFLGTVWGMVQAFEKIAGASEVTPQHAAEGIYQALITTAFGLIITVITTFTFYLFTYIIRQYANRLEFSASGLIKELEQRIASEPVNRP